MGRKKTYVSSTVVSMVTDSPNIIQQSVITSIANNTDIGRDIVINLSNGLASQLTSYYRMGQHDKNKINLFPTSTTTVYSTNVLDVQYVLDSLYGSTEILVCILEPLDTDYLAYSYMSQNYGYNFIDGSFQSLPNGLPLGRTKFFNSTHYNGFLRIEYSNESDEVIYTEDTNIPVTNSEAAWYHTVYRITGSETIYYWNYDTSTDAYPYLSVSDYNITDNYYPVVPIIRYGTNIVDDDTTDLYKLGFKLLRSLGIDYPEVSDGLKESEDYDKIEQAHFLPTVRINDNDQLSLKYLFNYFSIKALNSKTTEQIFENWKNNNYTQPAFTTERFRNEAFKEDLSWLYVTKEIINGSWSFGSNEYHREHDDSEEILYGGKNPDGQKEVLINSVISYFRKISSNQYEVVKVYGLTHINYVDNKYSVTSTVRDMFKSGDDDSEPVSIPISPQLVTEVFPKLLDRNTFTYRTMNLILSFKVTVKLKWYQTGLFQFVMIVVAIAITIYSFGALAASMSAAYATAGAGTAGIIAAASVAFSATFYAMATSIAMKWILEEYGVGVAAIIAVVLSAYFMSTSGTSLPSLPDSFSVTQFVDSMTDSFTDYFDALSEEAISEYQDVMEEQSEWMEEYDTMMDEMFGLSDSFAEAIKQHSIDQAIYTRMRPQTFIFAAVDMLTLIPELQSIAVDSYVDNALEATSEYDVI